VAIVGFDFEVFGFDAGDFDALVGEHGEHAVEHLAAAIDISDLVGVSITSGVVMSKGLTGGGCGGLAPNRAPNAAPTPGSSVKGMVSGVLGYRRNKVKRYEGGRCVYNGKVHRLESLYTRD